MFFTQFSQMMSPEVDYNLTISQTAAGELVIIVLPRVRDLKDAAQHRIAPLRLIGEDGTMGAGSPVTYEFLREISETYSGKNTTTPSGAVPANLLYADTRKGSEKYVWWNPPRKRTMYFAKSLGIPDGEYNVPGVVYVAGEGRLDIYAFIGEPTSDSELYFGPFFNTTNGSVCLGSSSLKRPSSPSWAQFIGWWEDRFWRTTFTHLGGGGNPTKNNLVLVTKASADRPFDTDELRPSGKKLKDLLK